MGPCGNGPKWQRAGASAQAEVYERLVEPFIAGVYAGDGARLSSRASLFARLHELEARSAVAHPAPCDTQRTTGPRPGQAHGSM